MGVRSIAALTVLVSPWLLADQSSAQSDIPRTPWGHPDLQGVWDYRTITPMQRPEEFGDRAYYTEEEIAELEGDAAERYATPPDTSVDSGLVHAVYVTDPGSRVDASGRNSLIIDPPNGRMPQYTAAAQAEQERRATERAAARDRGPTDLSKPWLDRPLLERCIARGFPSVMLPTLYNNNIEIVQSPGQVAIVHEMVHQTRVIPLDDREFSGIPSFLGESRGHFEGDTLVIETRNFRSEAAYRGSSENLVVTERFKRTPEGMIDFSMTLEDEATWVSPWTIAFVMRPTGGDLYEYACHEGNRGLQNILENIYDAADAAASGE